MTTHTATTTAGAAPHSHAGIHGPAPVHILPISAPLIKTYVHHAFPLAIAQTDGRSQQYLLFHFLQLYTRFDKRRTGINLDFFIHTGYYPQCPFIVQGEWKPAHEISDICATVIGLLRSNRYVEVGLDERFLHAKASYGQAEPNRHTSLIYGVDSSAGIFYAQGYVANGIYQEFQIRFTDIRMAFDEQGIIRTIAIDPGFHWHSTSELRERAKRYLRDYLAGACSFAFKDPLLRVFKWHDRWRKRHLFRSNNLFGVNVLTFLYHELKREGGRVMDIRPWCLIWEHKLILAALAQHLEVTSRDTALAARLRAVADGFYAVRNDVMEAWYRGQPIDEGRLRGDIDALLAAEEPAIRQLIDAL